MQRDIGHPIVGRFYDPIDHVNTMKQRPDLRLFVVSDHNDKRVSYRSQLEFVQRVKAHNIPITHVIAGAVDKDRHDLLVFGHGLAIDCVKDLEAERTWAVIKDTTTITVLAEFARRYLNNQHAALARARMEELRKSQAAAQATVLSGFDAVPRPPGASSQPKIPDRVGQPSQDNVAPAQRVVLYDEDLSDPKASNMSAR